MSHPIPHQRWLQCLRNVFASCSRCRPGRCCLSHTIIPFEGTCWVTSEELGIARRSTGFARLVLTIDGRAVRDESGRVLLRTHLMTFDALPLRYLDWLSGQDWLYGEFRERLTRYLKNPAIQRELEQLFRDPDDDSHRPLFMSSLPVGDRHVTFCDIDCPRWHRWHGQPMPAEEEPRDWRPPSPYTQWRQAWAAIADAMILFEHGTGEYEELNQLDIEALQQACKVVPKPVADRVRAAFTEWHTRMRELQHETDGAVIERAELLAEALAYGPVLFAGREKHVCGLKLVGKRRQWASCGVGVRGLRTTKPRSQRRSCIA